MAKTKHTKRTSTGGSIPRPDDLTRAHELMAQHHAVKEENYAKLANILIDDASEYEIKELQKSLRAIIHAENDKSEGSIRDMVGEMLDDEVKELETVLRTTIINEIQKTVHTELNKIIKIAVIKEIQTADFKKFVAARVEYEMKKR